MTDTVVDEGLFGHAGHESSFATELMHSLLDTAPGGLQVCLNYFIRPAALVVAEGHTQTMHTQAKACGFNLTAQATPASQQ